MSETIPGSIQPISPDRELPFEAGGKAHGLLLIARAGVVVEIGGLFSHAATVAREFGLPAVANIEGATDLLHDGDVVRVDGSRGVVEVIARAARATDGD